MSTGATCILYVDGVRFADGAPSDLEADPLVLSGLEVAWGRDTTVDQPAPSTCSFTVMDSAGGQSFLDRLHTGVTVDVTATGTDYPAPSAPTFADPGFEADPVAVITSNATAAASTRQIHGGGRSLAVAPLDPARRWSAVMPPAPFVPAGSDPGAWDGIPATAPGQTWDVGAWVYAPPGAEVTLRPVLFTGPWATAGRPVGDSSTLTGAGAWEFVSVSLTVDAAGSWVGVEIAAYPTGPAWDQLDPAVTWAELDPARTWADAAAVYVDDVTVLAPAGGTTRTVLVFSGRITNMTAGYDDTLDAPRVDVVAADFTADLENRDIGDEPWPAEAMGDRFNRILTLAAAAVTADIAASVYEIPISWRDVDNQPTTGLLQSLATSVDAVMWSAVHQTTGAYLKVEDPAARAAQYRLELVDGVVVVVGAGAGNALSACDVLRDPITFAQDVSDVTTRAAITWLEQITDDQGLPATAEHTVTVVDADLEARYGTRRVGVSTELAAQADALDVANRLLARLTESDWRASGFTVDDDDLADVDILLALLDGTSRIGLPVRVTDLPEWSPAGPELPLFLEGGQYRFDAGRWVLSLNVSSARGQGESVTWDQLDPAWTWDQLDPALTWAGLYGVAGPDLEVTA